MSGAAGRVGWEYGLDYGCGPRQCDDDQGEWKGLLVTSSRVGAWRTGCREVEWFDYALRRLVRQPMPGQLQDAWTVGTSHWAAIVGGCVLLYDEQNRIERSIDCNSGDAWRLGCATNASTLCLVGDDGIATVSLGSGSIHVEKMHQRLRGVTGLASDAWGRWLALTHAGDNVAWLAPRRSPGCLERLAGGFESDSTRLRLHAPRGCSFDGDALWVADSNNNRVVCLALSDGTELCSIDQVDDGQRVSPLWRPVAVHSRGQGKIFVLDSKNRRIVRLSKDGRQIGATGPTVVTRRHLHLPRSVTTTGDGSHLVCDSHQNRLITLHPDNSTCVKSRVRHSGVVWPRHAVELNGDLLVIGAHSGEPLCIKPSGRIDPWWPTGSAMPPLRDPHQCVLDGLGVLIVNSGAGEIIATRGDRRLVVCDVLGQSLSDPHAADFTYEGGIVIADTGNDRLVVSDPAWQQWRELRDIALPSGRLALRQPRFVSREHDGRYLIIDTGSRMIVRTDLAGRGAWAFGAENQLAPAQVEGLDGIEARGFFSWERKLFHDPRWVVSPVPGQLVVSDTGNCRVVSLHLVDVLPELR